MGLSDAQVEALHLLAMSPQARGIFNSGWGPWKAGPRSYKVNISEGTANGLISRGLAERWKAENDASAVTLRITEAGRKAIAS